jgi:hypothetical protein
MLFRFSRLFSNNLIIRNFAKDVRAQDSYEKLLDIVENYNAFSHSSLTNLVKNLSILSKDAIFNSTLKKFHSSPSMTSILNKFDDSIPLLTSDELSLVALNLGFLKINDEKIWNKIEKQINRKIAKELTPEIAAKLAEGASRSWINSKGFWVSLEKAVIGYMDTKNLIEPDSLIKILGGFHLVKQGQEIFDKSKRNIIAKIDYLDAKNLVKIVSLYLKLKTTDKELIIVLSKKISELRMILDSYGLQISISFLVKSDADEDIIDKIETEIINKIRNFNLSNITEISFLYGLHYSNLVMSPGKKRNLMEVIERYYFENKEVLISFSKSEITERSILKILWGLARGNVFNCITDWKKVPEELSSQNFEEENHRKMLSLIKEKIKLNIIN